MDQTLKILAENYVLAYYSVESQQEFMVQQKGRVDQQSMEKELKDLESKLKEDKDALYAYVKTSL